MTQNVMELGPQILSVAVGAFILLIFALAVAIPHRTKTLPGSQGHRDEAAGDDIEEIRADGYIDSFAGEIEEAGGGMPPVVLVALPSVILWWLLYLILNWGS
jgi:hypothetical protein